MNFMEFMPAIKNPQQFLANIISKNSNPMLTQLIQMAKDGNPKGVETFARNLFKEQNRDFDKEFSDFMAQIKG